MAIPGLPGGLIIYQGHLFPLKGHLCASFFLAWHQEAIYASNVHYVQDAKLTCEGGL